MSAFLRATRRLLARPKGPLGQRVGGGDYRTTIPYRSEVTMLTKCNSNDFNSNIRERFKKPIFANGIKAIPRDLGELPRNYVVKLLFVNQPIRVLDLWELCKQRDDVPLDSSKHLRQVLKIAKVMKWVYVEKNQTNDMWYYYVHQSRVGEVQEMIRQEATEKKEQEAQQVEQAAADEETRRQERSAQLDDSIQMLQNMLVQNVSRISQFDPQFVRSLPYVSEEGAVNVAWHFGGSTHSPPEESSKAKV